MNINSPKPISMKILKNCILLTCSKYKPGKKVYIYKKCFRLIPENIKIMIDSEEQLNSFIIKHFLPKNLRAVA